MAGTSLEVVAEENMVLPLEMIQQIVDRLPEHQQVCKAPFISRFFRANRDQNLPRIISSFELDKELLSNEIFEKHPIDYYKLYHQGRFCLPLMAQSFTSPECLAAFTGNMGALKALMGEEILRPAAVTNCTVVHFLAMGCQNKLILELVETHGVEILKAKDALNHSILHYAALGMNIKLIKLLIEKFGIDPSENNMFRVNWYAMLLGKKISKKNALILADVITNKETIAEIKVQLTTNSFEISTISDIPKFPIQYNLDKEDELNKLIVEVVTEIVTNQQLQHNEYLCYLLAYKQMNYISEKAPAITSNI